MRKTMTANKHGVVGRARHRLRPTVERHALGPRIYFVGVRWHEWHLGALILVVLAFGFALGFVHDALPTFLAVAAAILWAGRGAFYVRHQPVSLRAGALRAPLVLVAGWLITFALVVIAAPGGTSATTLVRETWDLLLWQPGPLTFHDDVGRLDLAVGLIGVATLVIAAYLVFRPLTAPRDLPDAEVRAAAREIVHAHGS